MTSSPAGICDVMMLILVNVPSGHVTLITVYSFPSVIIFMYVLALLSVAIPHAAGLQVAGGRSLR